MLTRFIRFQGFNLKKKDLRIKKFCDELKNKFKHKSDHILLSLSKRYKYSFNKKKVENYKKFKNFRVIGIGGSVLGAEAIYSFLKK